MSQTPLFAVMLMVLSMVSYQISASFAKQLFNVLDPFTVTTLRLCFASIIIIVMLRSWQVLKLWSLLKWRDLLCYSLALCLMNVLFYISLSELPQGIAVGLEFIGPLGLALLSIQRARDFIWVGCAILGIILMVPWGEAEQNFSIFGAVCALSAGLCWAFYIYFGQRVVHQNIGMHALSIAIALSAISLLPISLYRDSAALLDLQHWPKALAIAVLATAIPYALDLQALKRLNKLSYGTLSSLSPALAALTGLLLLGEQIGLWQWLALALIMLASIGVTLRSTHSATA